jgi:hypothetical protein
MVLKLKDIMSEGWWDVLSKKAQALYKKAHPGSQQAQNAKDKDTDDSQRDSIKTGIKKAIAKDKKGRAKMKKLNRKWDDAQKQKGKDDAEHEKEKKKLDQEIQSLDDAKWKAVDSGDGAAIRNWGEKLQKAKAKREKMSRTGNELNKETTMKETLTINGKQYTRIVEGKINSKFIKYRIYDKIADEINKVEPDKFNLRKFNSLKRKLIQFVEREVKRDKKMASMSVLKQAWKRADVDDEIFGRRGIIDNWYKKSEKDFSGDGISDWKKYNASSLTYGISKPLYKVLDSLLSGINNLVPESKHAFSEFYQRFKK